MRLGSLRPELLTRWRMLRVAAAIVSTIEKLLAEGGPRTRDMGGQAGTVDVGRAIAEAVAAG